MILYKIVYTCNMPMFVMFLKSVKNVCMTNKSVCYFKGSSFWPFLTFSISSSMNCRGSAGLSKAILDVIVCGKI